MCVFFMLLGRFLSFVPEYSLTSRVTFSRLSSLFLSDLSCSIFEMKYVANIKANVSE